MWTENQQMAIDARVSDNLVSAAAGSGKTAVMVERIVNRVVSGEVNIDKLLVVTYTNAAASELKSRLMQKIMEKLDTCENADNLNRQLMLINSASICTIHSFCLEILRNNFHRIGLDPGFKIADTGETELAKKEILDKIFNEYYENSDAEFLNLVDRYTAKNDFALMEIIFNMYDFSMSTPKGVNFIKENAEKFENDDFWIDAIYKSAMLKAKKAVAFYECALELCEFDENLVKIREIIENEKSMFENLLRKKTWNEAYEAMFCFDFATMRFSKKADANDCEKIKYYRNLAKQIHKNIAENFFTDTLENLKRDIKLTAPSVKKLSEVMLRFYEEFSKYKLDKNTVDFTDLEHMALKLLYNDNKPSDIANSYMERFEEIYVDEYQDCNSVQEAIFSSISRKNAGKPNMFMVGDMKQSIYRFRGSEPALFKAKSDSYSDYGSGDGKYNKIVLNKNFRSRDTILTAVNSVFRQLMCLGCGELSYTEEEYLYYNENSYEAVNEDMNFVDVVIIDEKKTDYDETDLEDFSEDLNSTQAEAVYVANRIKEMVSSGEYKVFDTSSKTYRPIRYSDIVILLRSVKGFAEVFNDILTTAQIPVYCDVGSGYFDSPEIAFLISYLKIIDNPYDDIALLSVMRHPVYSFTDDDFVTLRMENKEGFFYNSVLSYAKNNDDELSKKINDFIFELKDFYDHSKYLSADKLLWNIVEATDYMSYLSFLPNAELKKANVKSLFNRAHDFEKTDYKGIFNFIKYIDNLKKNNTDVDSAKVLGDDENVVRIMSIHKSKGLEFPVVFLSRSAKNFNVRDSYEKILFHKEIGIGVKYIDVNTRLSYSLPHRNIIKEKMMSESISEEMRVLYVALTRAREKLIITGTFKNADKKINDTAIRLFGENDVIDDVVSLSARSYLDWILMAVMRNKNCQFVKIYNFDHIVDDGSMFNISIIPKSELILEIDEGTQKRDFSLLNKADCDALIKSRLQYVYPYSHLKEVPANMSVTELKRLENEREDIYTFFNQHKLKTPSFMTDTNIPSGADIGTYTHLVMEKLDFNKTSTVDDIKLQLEEIVRKGFLNENQAEYVKCENIYNLFSSPLGKRMKNALVLKREFSFKYLMNVSEINNELNDDEKIVVQGMIDVYFEDENGGIVIVDYKTDKVKNNINDLVSRYAPQLKFYEKALQKSLGKNVSEKHLFFMDTGDIIAVD